MAETRSPRRRRAVWTWAAVFVVAGLLHFLRPGMYEGIMPPWLPAHRALVLWSGAAEIAGGLGLLWHPTRKAAGAGLVLLLIAVFPANVQMLLNAHADGTAAWWQALLAGRLLLQPLFVVGVWKAAGLPRRARA